MQPTRRIQVYIVTLFVEPGGELRGRLRPVQNDEETLFTGGEELLHLLRRAVADPPPVAETPGPSSPATPGGGQVPSKPVPDEPLTHWP
jgi:hypothetical protein